jgi:cytochrome c oxidase cbb3-type subunit III
MSDDNIKKDHEYDGISEYDNPLPAWWLTTFFVTIIFAFLYWLHYDITGAGPTTNQELSQDLAAIEKLKSAGASTAHGALDFKSMLKDPQQKIAGAAIFGSRCASCHGVEGQGLIGPNLTDNFWLHGHGGPDDIFNVVSKGVPDKGMPPWDSMLKPNEIGSVTIYIASLRGTHPSGAKAPQGQEIKD